MIRGDLVTLPVTYDVEDREPTALARLRAVDEALRDQREDRHRGRCPALTRGFEGPTPEAP
ncbi:hypothetical protein ABZ656_11290 [Streptomyces sp. NPDC007095]|uniref:hypothetical protein n=1 Tax=Streptomyces sp. NPDC007095 TaxID=3154482 RepID=UPI0033DEF518